MGMRPPVLVEELMKVRVFLMCVRVLELILMSGIAFKYAHREIPCWALWVVSMCSFFLLPSGVAEARRVFFTYSEHECLAHASKNQQLKAALEDFNPILGDMFLSAGADPNVEFDHCLKNGDAKVFTDAN